MLIKGALYPYKRVKLNQASKRGKLYQILVEKDAEFKPSQYVSFYESMYTMYTPMSGEKWFTIEFYGSREGVKLYSWLSKGVADTFLQANINAIHTAAEVVPAEDYVTPDRFEGYHKACAMLELESHYIFNLAQTDGDKALTADLVATLCAAMQNLDENTHLGVQFVLRPVSYRAAKVAKAYLEAYRKTGERPWKPRYPYSLLTPYLSVPKKLMKALKYTAKGSAGLGTKDVIGATQLNSMLRKLEAGMYFDLGVRIFCAHKTSRTKPNEYLQGILGAFAPSGDKNRFRYYRRKDKKYFKLVQITRSKRFLEAYAQRRIPAYPVENFVTPSELTTIVHMPSKHIPNVVRLQARKLPVPAGVITYDSLKQAWADDAIVFGVSRYRGRTKYLAFKDLWMLMQHMYCIGGTGAGKSYFLSFLGLQIAKHTGLTFFDVKGEVVDEFLQHLPKSEWHRVVYIDLQDAVRFLPFNMLKQKGMTVYNLATMIVNTFVKAFSQGSIKEHSASVLRKALIAVISADPEGTLLEVYRMFTDEAYLDEIISRMERGTDYPDILSYWRDIYREMRPAGRKQEAGAIINKLEVITQNERPRYMLCQKGNGIDWRKLMDEKKIILVNLSFGQNEPDIIAFFGTLFTSFISKAAFSRDNVPRSERVPHIFIVDEFEMFVHAEGDMKKFLEMARSYGLGMVLAHQSLEQLSSHLMGIIADNTFSQISLAVGKGSAPGVAKMMSSKAAPVEAEDLMSMEPYTGYARFRKLATQAFTFDSINMTEVFKAAPFEDVKKWKEEYKEKNYKHLEEIREEINERYSTVVLPSEAEESSVKEAANTKKGKADGKILKGRIKKREGVDILINAKETESKKGVFLNGAAQSEEHPSH